MQYLDVVIKIGSVITAVILIWKAIVFFVHLADDIKETKDYVKKNLKNVEDIPTIKAHCEENYMTGLKLTIMSSEMPLGERIVAGEKYLTNNGNGEIKKFINEELHANQVCK